MTPNGDSVFIIVLQQDVFAGDIKDTVVVLRHLAEDAWQHES
jgi:hypothetical protein